MVNFKKLRTECQKYSIAKYSKPTIVKKKTLLCQTYFGEARRPKTKRNFSGLCHLIRQYNLILPNINFALKNIYLYYTATKKFDL